MKAIVAILSAALVALGGAVIHLWRQLDASRQHVAGLQTQVDTTAASARQLATIAPSPSLPLAQPTAAAPDATPAALRAAMDEQLSVAMANAGSPESIARGKVVQRAQMPTEYPDVGIVLGLSPDEVGRLYDLLTEQRARQRTLDTKVAGSLARAAQSEKDELASLLGSKYAKWQEYKTELPTRRQVKDLDTVLSSTGAPLSDAQRNALIPAVLAAERSNSQERAAKFGQGSLDFTLSRYSLEANQQILYAAAAHLTPQQLESYRLMLERASRQETALRDMSRGVQR